MSWAGLASNQFVSFTDAQGSGFTQKVTLPTSDRHMDKDEALYYLNLDASYMSGITADQFPQKSQFVAGYAAPTITSPYFGLSSEAGKVVVVYNPSYTSFPAGFSSYKMYRGATLIYTGTSNSSYVFNDTGGTQDVTYDYTIVLTDSLGQTTTSPVIQGTKYEADGPYITSCLCVTHYTYLEFGVGATDDSGVYSFRWFLMDVTNNQNTGVSGILYPSGSPTSGYWTENVYWGGYVSGRTYRFMLIAGDIYGTEGVINYTNNCVL